MTKFSKLKSFINRLPETEKCIKANLSTRNEYRNVAIKGHIAGISLAIFCIHNKTTPCEVTQKVIKVCKEPLCINPNHFQTVDFFDGEIRAIRKERKDHTLKQLSEKYNRSITSISQICNYNTYKKP